MKPKLKIFFLSIIFLFGIIFTASTTKAADVTKTTLEQSENTIFVNDQYTIPLTGKVKNATYIYTSNKTKVAKVNSKGVVTGLDNGSASIKIRCKYDGELYSVGTFTVNVNKTSLNDKYKAFDMLTGDKLEPKKYLEKPNPGAVYFISSSSPKVASGGSDGIIHATKAGRAAISIYEVYNEKSRPVGAIGVSVTGASFKKDAIKMAYNMSINNNELLEDTETGATYKFMSSNSSLVSTSSTRISSTRSGSTTQTCDITVQETTAAKKTHTIGTLKVTVTNNTFISSLGQEITIGFGEVLTVGSGIVIYNKTSGATYKLNPADVAILKPEEVKNSSTKLESIGYGSTDVTIEEIKGGKTTALEDKVNVTVNQAQILDELLKDGLKLSVNGSTYDSYPFKYRNVKATYDYISANSQICSVGSGGVNKDEDFLVARGKKIGETTISVYETVTNISPMSSKATSAPTIKSIRKKIGTFDVIVSDDYNASSSSSSPNPSGSPSASGSPAPSGSPDSSNAPDSSNNPDVSSEPEPTDEPDPTESTSPSGSNNSFDSIVASTLLDSISLNYNNNEYKGYVSDFNSECIFGDDEYNPNGYIDYGTNFDRINKNDFTFDFKNGVTFADIESHGTEWTLSVNLNDEDNTVEDITIVLNEGEFDTRSVISNIKVEIPNVKAKTIDATTSDKYDEETKLFDDGNRDFKVYFKPDEYCTAGAHDFDDYSEKVQNEIEKLSEKEDSDELDKFMAKHESTLSEVADKMSCTVTLNNANTAMKNANGELKLQTDDGQYFEFEVEFENDVIETFTVELDVDLD